MIEKVKRFGAWRWAPLCVGIVMAICAMLLGLFFDCGEVDTMTRYAPMAEFFAQGNWQEVFHPRFPLLFQTLAGVLVWATGMPGYIACFLISTCFWGLAIPLLFLVMERIFDRQTAWLTVVLYIICPMLLTYSLFGLRESLRTLGTLLVVYAIFRRRDEACGTLLPLLAGMLILCTVRSDTLLLGLILWAIYAWFDRAGWRTWCTAAWALLCVQPMCYVTYHWLGVWLPSSQWVGVWNRLF
jgi:predicted membrane-bound mannosyltransferase